MEREHIEPVALKAYDPAVLLRGKPIRVDFRIIAEDEYQFLLQFYKFFELVKHKRMF